MGTTSIHVQDDMMKRLESTATLLPRCKWAGRSLARVPGAPSVSKGSVRHWPRWMPGIGSPAMKSWPASPVAEPPTDLSGRRPARDTFARS
jgi:hypothetical protein